MRTHLPQMFLALVLASSAPATAAPPRSPDASAPPIKPRAPADPTKATTKPTTKTTAKATNATGAPQPSTLSFSLRQPLQGLFQQLEKMIPEKEDHEHAWMPVKNGRALKFRWMRTPMTFSLRDGKLVVQTVVRYRVQLARRVRGPFRRKRKWVRVGTCGVKEPMRAMTLTLTTRFDWQPEWKLTTRSKVTSHFHDPCLVSAFNINIAPNIKNRLDAKFKTAAFLIDTFARRKLNVRPAAERVWRRLHTPIALPQQPGLYLHLAPEQLSVSPPSATGDVMELTVALRARPRINNRPTPTVLAPLPALTLTDQADHLHVTLAGQIPLQLASAQIGKTLSGKVFAVGTHQVRVEGAKLTHHAGKPQLHIAFSVQGAPDVRGTLKLEGRPVFDLRDNTLSLVNTRHTLETRNAYLKTHAWLLHDSLRDAITRRARWDMSAHMKRPREGLQALLRRTVAPGVTLSGALTSLRLLEVRTDPAALHVRVALLGDARIELERELRDVSLPSLR